MNAASKEIISERNDGVRRVETVYELNSILD